jgi:hypothetical protein
MIYVRSVCLSFISYCHQTKSYLLSRIYYCRPTSFQDPVLRFATVAPTSHVCLSAMFLLLSVVNLEVQVAVASTADTPNFVKICQFESWNRETRHGDAINVHFYPQEREVGYTSEICVFINSFRYLCFAYQLSKRTSYVGVSKSFRTGRLGRELQMVQLSVTRYSFIAILWVNLVSFAAITLCIASQLGFIVV